MVVAEVEGMGKHSDSYFEVKYTDGEGEEKVKLRCKVCDYENSKEGGMKRHITAMHKDKVKTQAEKRRLSGDKTESSQKKAKEGKNAETVAKEFDEALLDEWDTEGDITATQVSKLDEALSMCEKEEGVKVTEKDGEKKDETEIMKRDIEELKQDNVELKATVASLEETVETKDNLLDIYKAKNESLEMEAINKDAAVEKYQRCLNKMLEKINTREDKKEEPDKDAKAKVKKLSDEVKEKEKKVVEAEKKLVEMTRKLGEESNLRVKAEAEVVRIQKMSDNMVRIMEKKDSGVTEERREEGTASREERKVWGICYDLSKPGGCRFGSRCKYEHPAEQGRRGGAGEQGRGRGGAGEEQGRREDCYHWLQGACMFPDYKCDNIHDQQKKGSRLRLQQQQQQQAFVEAPAMVRGARSTAVGGGEAGQQQPVLMVVGQQPMGGQQYMLGQQQQVLGQQHMVGQQQQPMVGQQYMVGQQQVVGQPQQPMVVQQPGLRPMMVPMQGWPGHHQ